ncbi:MAG: 50S ribosomal protein L11 methyltransferase [Flavobacteriales bacterium]
MSHTLVEFELQPLLPAREVLLAELAELGFESFEETPHGLRAYIPSASFSEELLQQLMTAQMDAQVMTWKIFILPEQNWNEAWERNFDPIVVDEKCLIKAPFHKGIRSYPLEIIIEPKMSFGTGHHATTHLMLGAMLRMNWKNKQVLDMGSGTGVLAIAAEKLGAAHCTAIDIDIWAYENALENAERNQCTHITCIQGGAETIATDAKYDVVLANINRNILQRDMHLYVAAMSKGASILLSGFYVHDVADISRIATPLGLALQQQNTRDEWCMLHYILH